MGTALVELLHSLKSWDMFEALSYSATLLPIWTLLREIIMFSGEVRKENSAVVKGACMCMYPGTEAVCPSSNLKPSAMWS